jgi:hypothetical protein
VPTVTEARKARCDLYVCDLQIRKVVGATGFEPATPCAQERGLAILCNVSKTTIGLKFLIRKPFDACHRMTSPPPHRPAEPEGTPQKSYFRAGNGTMPPCFQSPNRPGRVASANATKRLEARLLGQDEALDDLAIQVGECEDLATSGCRRGTSGT